MPIYQIPLRVALVDGTELDVKADQRDLAAAEAAGYPDAGHMWTRYVGWSAAHRDGHLELSFKDANEGRRPRAIIEVRPNGEPTGGERLDPTNPAPTSDD